LENISKKRKNLESRKTVTLTVAFAHRCGVMKPDKDPLEPGDACYCPQEQGLGVKAGFWHKMEVLSLPYTPDLFWPNTSAFQVSH
jgi:hypothetical protein